MALSILDGNQSATTLSTILSSGQHITAHTVVSLGTQAITDIVNATSTGLTNTQLRASAVTIGGTVTVGNSVTISSLPAISGTVTVGSLQNIVEDAINNVSDFPNSRLATAIYEGNGEASPARFIGVGYTDSNGDGKIVSDSTPFPVRLLSTINVQAMAGTARIGVVTIGAGTVTIGAGTAQIGSVTASISNFPATQAVSLTTLPALVAGTAQIGSVTASISGTVPVSGTFFQATQPASLASLPALAAGTNQIGSVTASISGTVPVSISSVTVGNSVTIGSLSALVAGTAQIGSVTASISNTVVTFFPAQGTTVTNSNFTSTTASTTLVSAVAGRDVLTVFNEGAGNLFISPGATATTISYQVRLSAGDYWECPEGQRSLIHTAVFATAGTARVTEVS